MNEEKKTFTQKHIFGKGNQTRGKKDSSLEDISTIGTDASAEIQETKKAQPRHNSISESSTEGGETPKGESTKIETDKYELAKPKRIIIKGKVSSD